MTRRPEYVEAIRALGGSTGDPTPVIRLLRDPSGLPAKDWRELVALIAELLSTDEELRKVNAVSEAGGISGQVAHVSINPLVLRVRGNGKGRLKKGQGTEDTRRRWIAELVQVEQVSEGRGTPGEFPSLSEIADALEGVGRYRLTLERRRAGNVEGPESESLIYGHMLFRKNRAERNRRTRPGQFEVYTEAHGWRAVDNERLLNSPIPLEMEMTPHADSFGGCWESFTLDLAAKLGMSQRAVAGHWQIYRDVMLRFYRQKITELIAVHFK